jgi:hypothetical protein
MKSLLTPILFVLLATFALNSCDNAIESNYKEQIVVAAFLYANEPIDSVVLHRTTPFGQYYDDKDFAVDSAQVTITVAGVPHTLQAAAQKGRYFLPASELIVDGGKTYELSVVCPNHQTGGTHHVTASTVVPMPIHFTSGVDSIRGKDMILDTNDLSHFPFIITAGPVDDPNRKYLLSVTALDTTKGKVGLGDRDTQFITRYWFAQTGPKIAVIPILFGWWGKNLITFRAIDTNWADYQRQTPPFNSLNYEPSLNHVIGGIGIFGSGARDTVTVFLKPKD